VTEAMAVIVDAVLGTVGGLAGGGFCLSSIFTREPTGGARALGSGPTRDRWCVAETGHYQRHARRGAGC
jgi:hypothetical protein